MTTPADPLQRISAGIATIINADATVIALTAQPGKSIGRWRRRKALAAPALSYVAGPATPAGGIGETYEITVALRAEARTAETANALLRAGAEALTTTALLAAGCDAVVESIEYDNPPDESDDQPTDPNIVRVEAELTINLTM